MAFKNPYLSSKDYKAGEAVYHTEHGHRAFPHLFVVHACYVPHTEGLSALRLVQLHTYSLCNAVAWTLSTVTIGIFPSLWGMGHLFAYVQCLAQWS